MIPSFSVTNRAVALARLQSAGCALVPIGPHAPLMRERIAAALGLTPEDVSVKATTNERIGFIGRGEGIAALAVATIDRTP